MTPPQFGREDVKSAIRDGWTPKENVVGWYEVVIRPRVSDEMNHYRPMNPDDFSADRLDVIERRPQCHRKIAQFPVRNYSTVDVLTRRINAVLDAQ